MRNLLLITSLALLAPLAAAEEPQGPLTSYEAGPMRLANLVVAGRTLTVKTQRQQQIATVEVLEVLRGTPPTKPLTVFVRGPHPAANLRDPNGSTFPRVGTPRHVFFLRTRPRGVACDFSDAFVAEGDVGDAKIGALKKEISLAAIKSPETRAKETLAYLVGALSSKRPWTSAHATRELLQLAKSRRDLIDERLEQTLVARQRRPIPRAERASLGLLVKYLRENPRVEREATAGRAERRVESDPWRAAFKAATEKRRTVLIEEVLADPGPEDLKRALWSLRHGAAPERRLVVRRLTDLGQSDLLGRIRGLYAGEEDHDVRLEIVRAVGLLGTNADVGWLAERSRNLRLERAALLGLARIRSESALEGLRIARRRILAEVGAGGSTRLKWIDYLLSDAFEASTLMR